VIPASRILFDGEKAVKEDLHGLAVDKGQINERAHVRLQFHKTHIHLVLLSILAQPQRYLSYLIYDDLSNSVFDLLVFITE